MVTENEVLNYFQDALPILGWLPTKKNSVGMDDILQEYTEQDDLLPVIEQFGYHFSVDMSLMNLNDYYPWVTPWFFRKWFTSKPVIQEKKPLTVRMFSESAKAGRWLYE